VRIVRDAVERVRVELEVSGIATAFVGTTFTMAELRAVYEAIWSVQLDAANFRRSLVCADALDFAGDCQAAYRAASPSLRRQLNQAFFKNLYIDDDDLVRSELAAPFDIILSDDLRAAVEEVTPSSLDEHELDWRVWPSATTPRKAPSPRVLVEPVERRPLV
jgi:hypothetical protein